MYVYICICSIHIYACLYVCIQRKQDLEFVQSDVQRPKGPCRYMLYTSMGHNISMTFGLMCALRWQLAILGRRQGTESVAEGRSPGSRG